MTQDQYNKHIQTDPTGGWVVRYWDADGGQEQTAHFPDVVHGVFALERALAYAQHPSLGGKALLRLEVQRYRG
jgi:hypothetical protein